MSHVGLLHCNRNPLYTSNSEMTTNVQSWLETMWMEIHPLEPIV